MIGIASFSIHLNSTNCLIKRIIGCSIVFIGIFQLDAGVLCREMLDIVMIRIKIAFSAYHDKIIDE
jgi:hypothetical protein